MRARLRAWPAASSPSLAGRQRRHSAIAGGASSITIKAGLRRRRPVAAAAAAPATHTLTPASRTAALFSTDAGHGSDDDDHQRRQQAELQVKQLMRPLARDAWIPSRRGLLNRFGGVPSLRHDEEPPACGECSQPLSFYLQLEVGALPEPMRESFGGDGLFQLFVCTEGCELHHPETAVCRVRHDELHLGRADSSTAKFEEQSVTGWNHQQDFPSPQGLFDNNKAVVTELEKIDTDWPRLYNSIWLQDKLGGHTNNAEASDKPNNYECSECGNNMAHLLQLGNSGVFSVGRGGEFYGRTSVQVYRCLACEDAGFHAVQP